MEQFAQDVQVQTKFVEVAISRSVIPERIGDYNNNFFSLLFRIMTLNIACLAPSEEQQDPPIKLVSADPRDYRSSTLYKLLPLLVNPKSEAI